MNIFIGSLPFAVKDEALKELFATYGEVSSARVVTDKFTGRSKGFGFVEMPNDSEAEQAISALNGKAVKNREISVTVARPKTEGGDRGNRGGYSNNRR